MDRQEISNCLPKHLELCEKIGDGGFATVYRIRNSKLQSDWALKIIDVARLTVGKETEKILKEARLPAQIHHPNVVTIHDVDEVRGFVFMELVDGPSLSGFVTDGLNSWTDFRDMGMGILAGLAEAHRAGIVHGDISPKNILLTQARVPKLVDFGFAQHLDQSVSRIGVTPGYASPEHILMRPIAPQSDVFSVAVILYELATGSHPFGWDGRSSDSYAYLVISENATPPRFRFPIPDGDVERLLLRALHRESGMRYPSAVEMERAFSKAAQGESNRTHKSVTMPSRAFWQHYERGLKYYSGTSKQEMDWAEESFRQALKDSPGVALAHVGLADVAIFRYMSYFDRTPASLAGAEQNCRQAIALDPDCAEAFRSLGRIYFTRRDFGSAQEHLQKAIQLNPDYLAAHISLAWNFIESHDLEEAERVAQSAKVIADDEYEVMMTFSRIYYDTKQFERSLAISADAAQMHRMKGRAYYELAMAQRAVGDFETARANFRLSLEYHGDPRTHIDLGVVELLEGNVDAAKTTFTDATGRTFGFLACYLLGFTAMLTGDTGPAQSAFQQSFNESDKLSKRDPVDPLPRAVAAMATAGMGDSRRATTLAAMARELDPIDGLIAYYCAYALSWSDKEAATHLRDEALRLPHSPSPLEASFDPHFRT